MKKLIYLLTLSVSFLVLYSCSPQEDDIFNESAANRMTDQLKEYQSILTSAPNGWLMQYYPSNTQAYGGYNYLLSFGKGDSVVISGDIANPETTETSLYALISDAGPVLTFNTYNSLLHFFSEPKGSSDIDGYAGDYEFTFMEATPQKIVLKGKKSGNRIVMTPVPAGQNWKEYLQSIISLDESSLASRYKVYLNDRQILTIRTSDRSFVIPDTINGIPEPYRAGFIYTPEGIQMYEPLNLGGVDVTNFKWDATRQSFISVGTTAEVRLESYPPSHFKKYDFFIGNWTFKYGTKQLNIQILEKEAGKSYTMKGLPFDITLEYDRLDGAVNINPQYVGRYNAYYVHVCVLGGGYVTWSESISYRGIWDEQEGTPKVVFGDSGTWDYPVSGFTFCAFSSLTASGGSYLGRLTDQYPSVTITKK